MGQIRKSTRVYYKHLDIKQHRPVLNMVAVEITIIYKTWCSLWIVEEKTKHAQQDCFLCWLEKGKSEEGICLMRGSEFHWNRVARYPNENVQQAVETIGLPNVRLGVKESIIITLTTIEWTGIKDFI